VHQALADRRRRRGRLPNDSDRVWCRDYHIATQNIIVRRMSCASGSRRRTILTFWHIPCPMPSAFAICPFGNEILEGLLGSTIVGFQTASATATTSSRVSICALEVRIAAGTGRRAAGPHDDERPYPISNRLAGPLERLGARLWRRCRQQVRYELRLARTHPRRVRVRSPGLHNRGSMSSLWCIERTLEQWPRMPVHWTFVQVGAPSRTRIERYRELGVTGSAPEVAR
jgi:trehalose 6-phosphate synthase